MTSKYKIIRNFFRGEAAVIRRNVTLEEAQAHCKDPQTSSRTATEPDLVAMTEALGPWFDGYTSEDDNAVF